MMTMIVIIVKVIIIVLFTSLVFVDFRVIPLERFMERVFVSGR